MRRLAVVALSFLCALGAEAATKNVVMIAIDTLRADALGLYGSEFDTSPYIDALGSESIVFERAWAQGTYTVSSFLSYMTSKHVRSHGWDRHHMAYPRGGICSWDDLETLAEVLGRNGFRRDAFVVNAMLHPKAGFPRGFETWNEARVVPTDGELRPPPHLSDTQAVAGARRVLAAWKPHDRHLLYVHLMAPHLPLTPSPEARERFGASSHVAPGGQIGAWLALRWRKDPTPERQAAVRAAYRASVWDADRLVKSIVDEIAATGHRETTIVVVFADHGEELWEHGDYQHEQGVWEQLVHVPLVVHAPGIPASRIRYPVGLIDLAPTLLRMLRIDERPESWQGEDLFDPIRAGAGAVSERFLRVAVTLDGRAKGIASEAAAPAQRWSFYDLVHDPSEQERLTLRAQGARAKGLALRKLQRTYTEWIATTPMVERDWNADPVGICAALSRRERDEREEMLRALGYVE